MIKAFFKTLTLVVSASAVFVFTLNNKVAKAGIPQSYYSSKVLKQNGVTKHTIPKKFRGTWHNCELDDGVSYFSTLKITKSTIDGSKAKVGRKLVKIKGVYRLPIYVPKGDGFSYMYLTDNKLAMSVVAPSESKSKITKTLVQDVLFYKTKKQARTHKGAQYYMF